MPRYKVDVSELAAREMTLVGELEGFLRGRVGNAERSDDELTVEIKSKRALRQVLKKFLHRVELEDEFRVISGVRNSLRIKRRKPRPSR